MTPVQRKLLAFSDAATFRFLASMPGPFGQAAADQLAKQADRLDLSGPDGVADGGSWMDDGDAPECSRCGVVLDCSLDHLWPSDRGYRRFGETTCDACAS
jgi:hypothetical protein